MSIAKKLKSIIKGIAPSSKFGSDPNDPWSAKANINEAGSLNRYLLSRGINPQVVSKDTKISHAKSGQFLKWKQEHQFEEVEQLGEDAMLDVYLKSRGMNPAFMTTEKKISIAKSTAFIVWKQHHMHEDVVTEGRMKDIATDNAETERLNKMSTLAKFRANAGAREKKHDDIAKNSGGMTSAIDRLQKHLNKEETIDEHGDPWERDEKGNSVGWKATQADREIEAMKAHVKKYPNGNPNTKLIKPSDMIKSVHKFMNKEETIDEMDHKFIKQLNKLAHRPKEKEEPVKEDIFQDGQAATQTSFDGANSPDNTEPKTPGKKSQMSKSARMIKSLYKHNNMKEELYDSEKEDKSVKTYGKKPKMQQVDAEKMGDDAPQAAAVLSGGKTLTGQTRDTLEIDPMMRRPLRPDNKQTNKKNYK